MLFPQAEQIINTDRFYAGSLRLLLLVTVFMTAGLWLLLGNLTFYETSSRAQQTNDNLIRATFSHEEVETLAVEQTATVLFTDADGRAQTTVALIVRIIPNADDEQTQLDLLVTERAAFIALFDGDSTVEQVRVLREALSPLNFILDAAGLTEP